jgi:hypothetical protein
VRASSDPDNCNGGHSFHIGAFMDRGRVVSIPPTTLLITMVDWVQVDNDGDLQYDEEPIDGVDNDGDGLVDEDPAEPGKDTVAIDCDSGCRPAARRSR